MALQNTRPRMEKAQRGFWWTKEASSSGGPGTISVRTMKLRRVLLIVACAFAVAQRRAVVVIRPQNAARFRPSGGPSERSRIRMRVPLSLSGRPTGPEWSSALVP